MLDIKKLKYVQGNFFMQFPGGFDDPELLLIAKKHRLDKMVEFAQQSFSPVACSNIYVTADNMVKLISRSSMVSLFEKPKFRDFVKRLNDDEKAFMVNALKQFLNGSNDRAQQAGFEALTDLLATEKLAKWSLISIFGAYYSPTKEVFVKPTTAKNILAYFAITDPVYKPKPSWDFYQKYRQLINDAKSHCDPRLSPSNAAFSGFLMMSMKP